MDRGLIWELRDTDEPLCLAPPKQASEVVTVGKCECDVCRLMNEYGMTHEEALELGRRRDQEAIKKHGWVAHAIVDRNSVHTHGLPESFGHLDLEVCLPVPPEKAHLWLAALVDEIKHGRRFKHGDHVNDVFLCPVRFHSAVEDGRQVLRVIFPDRFGRFPGDLGCEEGFSEQLNNLAGE